MKMSTPIVDSVPTVAENCGIKMQEDTGFPFEDDFDDRHSFRSQLDEIAQRHPEFAQHLHFDQFPARGRRRRGSDERTQPQPPPENRRFERPFRSRFEEFGFPFGRDFEEPQFYREEVPQYQEYQHQHPPQESQQETARETEEKSEKDAAGLNKNIQQSNTVDLGKNQEPVDDQRGQRSMSAPPENRPAQQRFVSSINIPVQTQTAGGPSGDMGAKPSQPQSEKPMERVIPIHVEGRDEPVIPKNPYFTATQQQPQPERIFGRNPSHFTQFLNKGEPQMTPEEYFKPQQRNYQQKHQQNFQDQPPQPSPQHDKHQEKEKQQEEQQQPPQKSTQLDQIQNIQKDVSELMNQVEKFEGKLKDKQYLYLDEMLTRNLIKLDNIETEGKENIRQARKEAIKCIESCIAILEAKANANYAKEKQQQEESMEVEKQSPEQPEKQDDQSQEEQNEAKNDTKDQAIEEKEKQPHHKEKEDETKEEQTLEVSGVARSGTIANIEVPSTTPMEVTAESENVETKEEEEKKEEVMPPGEAVPEIEEKVEEKKEKKKTTKKKEKADKK